MGNEYSIKPLSAEEDVTAAVSAGRDAYSKRTNDETVMAYFGKKQQLRRRFGFLSMVGLTCALLSTWEGVFVVFLYGFSNGGPAGLVIGFLFGWVGTLAVVCSMAEMGSMMPLAGGQYNWVALLAPPKWANFLSYVTGWVTAIGWQAASASTALLGGTIIQGLIIINYPNYKPQPWHGTLLFYAVVFVALFCNTVVARFLPTLEGFVLIIHIAGFFAILIPLVYLAPHGDTTDVFRTFLNEGGWSSDGLAFFVGLITPVYSFLGSDSACHMAEEIHNAAVIVPWSMVTTIMLNGVLGFAMLIAVLFCLGNVQNAMNTPTNYPFIEIFQQATNSLSGATAMTAVLVALDIFAAVGILATSSRMLWAFARDNGLPGSKYLTRVEPRTQLPLYSIGVSVIINLLLALINIGSSAAFNAIVSLVVAGFFSSYIIAIVLILYRRIRGDPLRWGPWRMGIVGIPVNIIAIIYSIIVMVFSFFPGTSTVTLVTMNWSCLVFGGVMILSILLYMVHGHKVYRGPIIEVQDE